MALPQNKALYLMGCLLMSMVLSGCGGTPLSEREIVRGVLFAQQGGAFSACLVVADQEAEDTPRNRAVAAAGETPAQALQRAEDALPGQAYYGLLDLAALPAQTDWQTAQQIGTLLYDVAQPAPELSVFALAEAGISGWEEEAPALYEAMKAAESAYEVHCGLQQLFAQSEVCAVPALAQSGYDLLLLPRGGAPLRCRGLAGAQLAAVLCGQAQRLQGTFAGGQAACEADAHVTVEGQTVQLHLRACALQALTGQAPDDLESALQRELQASFAALYGQTHRAGADPFHLDFWQACTYGPGHPMQDPQLTVLFE